MATAQDNNFDYDFDETDDFLSAEDTAGEVQGGPDSNGMYEHFRFFADKGQQLLRVDKFLVDHLQKASRNRIQQAADAGCIIVNRGYSSRHRLRG